MSRHLASAGLLSVWMVGAPIGALAATPAAMHSKLRELEISAGHWVYHGQFLAGHQARQPWTWNEHCRWSDNRVFMLCSFSNEWAGRHVNSVVVDTYDPQHHTFWHYELFNSGSAAGKPFASRMRIAGPTRTESWTETHAGKVVRQRIVYHFTSATSVTVEFQSATHGAHWQTTASGTGHKVGPAGSPGH